MSEHAILVEGLRKSFGEVVALAGVDFAVPTGTVLGLLGPNGAGKTTAVRILTTILRRDGGRAEVLGIDVDDDPQAVRERIGLAGQYAAVDENLTGYENLRLVGLLTHLPERVVRGRADELLAWFDLADARNRPVRTYSGGMRRRLDLAAALVHRPPVLFLDEPTTGLDPRSRTDLWGVISQLVGEGATVLLTTQYLEEADLLADRIVVIDRGEVIAEGTSSELKANIGQTIIEIDLADPGNAAASPIRARHARPVRCRDRRPHRRAQGERRVARRGRGGAHLGPRRPRAGLARAAGTDARRRLPVAHRSRRRGAAARGRTVGGRARARARCRMTTTTLTTPALEPRRRSALGWAIADTRAITWRNLVTLRRLPQLLVFSTIQPVIFVLLFRYVFGGAIHIPGVDYVNYLMPGIFAQTVTFGAIQTGIGLAEDLHKGLIERFRSLPMSRSAVLAGRTLADLVRNVFVVALMIVVGYLVGFRVQTGVLGLLAGVAVILLFGFSLTWIFAIIGLMAPNAETAQAMSFPILAPLVFASSAFVAVDTMPGWLQPFATYQPVSVAVDAVRSLMLGGQFHDPAKVAGSLAWSIGIVAVFAPLAVRVYRRAA